MTEAEKIKQYIEKVLSDKPDFTGNIQLNFKDGVLMDVVKSDRTKFSN